MSPRSSGALILVLTLSVTGVASQAPVPSSSSVLARVEAHAAHFGDVSRQIWEFAEPGFQETKSSALLVQELKQAGFRVREGVAEMPTAFVAEWGSGKPVIGIMGEYDSLPGLSQENEPEKRPRVAGGYGHGCGHNLLGSAAALASVAVKETLEAAKIPGTIRYYGTPAEEGGDGKIYMIRAGLFSDADVILTWHPNDRNIATLQSTLALIGAKFRFHGTASHAAAAPEKGRSALDAAMLMGHAVDMLREHIPQESRMHYVITHGGDAPNIVPAETELYLFARHPHMQVLDGIWSRVLKCAEAGALATDTTLTLQLVGSDYDILPNDALTSLIDRRLREVGGITYTPEEQAFAEGIRKTVLTDSSLPLGSQQTVRPMDEPVSFGSTDAGDVSWVVPMGWFTTATNVPGVSNHSWQATACTGGTIGRKAMVVAAKTLALSAIDLFTDPAQVKAARESFEKRRAGLEYKSRIPADMKPPLNYREIN
jgi:aminobenzoyl-glutamate utilization protein B